eukprot:2149799-Rhodomonas_salina.6
MPPRCICYGMPGTGLTNAVLWRVRYPGSLSAMRYADSRCTMRGTQTGYLLRDAVPKLGTVLHDARYGKRE